MKTEKVNFKGFYRIPQTSQNLKKITDEIIPVYNMVCPKPVMVIEGIPFNKPFNAYLEQVAQKEGYSKEWLINHAKLRGLDIPDFNTNKINIISGTNDIELHNEFILDSFKKIKSNFNFFNTLKYTCLDFFSIGKDAQMPFYLKNLKIVSNVHKNFLTSYEQFLKDRKVTDVSSTAELLAKMLTEK